MSDVIPTEEKEKVLGTGLWISRVPSGTKKIFKELAKEHFEDDYGMCLKYLIDEIQKSSVDELLAERIMDFEERLTRLEGKPAQSEQKSITLLNGKKLEKR